MRALNKTLKSTIANGAVIVTGALSLMAAAHAVFGSFEAVYYSDPGLTQQVGFESVDCNFNYTFTGQRTQYYTYKDLTPEC